MHRADTGLPRPSTTARLAALAALSSSLLAACGGGGGSSSPPAGPPAPAALCTASAPIPSPGASAPQVTMSMSNGAGVNGDVVLTLDPGRAPATVANFLNYVNAGFYDGTVIHRRSAGFVIQGGGYAGPLAVSASAPLHKPVNAPIALEDNVGLSNLCLTVAMARTGTPDSATSEFFINLNNNTGLDRTGSTASTRGYAVFGSVTSGSDVITATTTAACTAWPGFLPGNDCLPTPNITVTRARQTR